MAVLEKVAPLPEITQMETYVEDPLDEAAENSEATAVTPKVEKPNPKEGSTLHHTHTHTHATHTHTIEKKKGKRGMRDEDPFQPLTEELVKQYEIVKYVFTRNNWMIY